MLDDTKYNNMASHFPKNVRVPINKKLAVTRTWFRNYYAIGVIGAFALYLYKQPQIFQPYQGYANTVSYKAQPDFLNSQVVLYSQQRQNTLTNF